MERPKPDGFYMESPQLVQLARKIPRKYNHYTCKDTDSVSPRWFTAPSHFCLCMFLPGSLPPSRRTKLKASPGRLCTLPLGRCCFVHSNRGLTWALSSHRELISFRPPLELLWATSLQWPQASSAPVFTSSTNLARL